MNKKEGKGTGETSQSTGLGALVGQWVKLHELARGEGLPGTGLYQKEKRIHPDSMDARRMLGRAIKDHQLGELMELVEEKGFGIDVVIMDHTTPKIALMACVETWFLEGFKYLESRGHQVHGFKKIIHLSCCQV